MLVLAGEVDHLVDLAFGHFIAEHAAHADPALMHVKHDPGSIFDPHPEETLQAQDDELHGRIIVVEHQHLVRRGLLRARARARCDTDSGAAISVLA